MASDFMIGTDLVYSFLPLDEILTETQGDPDWSFQPYSQTQRAGNGQLKGHGFPVAKWRWNAIADIDREALKDFVGADLSAELYIRTATNETADGVITFKTFSCILNWPSEDEDFQADKVLGLILIFSHLIEVEE
jgi:hypothetical protein